MGLRRGARLSPWDERYLRFRAEGSRPVTADTILELGRSSLYVTLLISAPMLVSGMLVGLVISVFQSVTQIQEITLTFVPKIVVVMAAFLLFLPWMVSLLLSFVHPLLGGFTQFIQ